MRPAPSRARAPDPARASRHRPAAHPRRSTFGEPCRQPALPTGDATPTVCRRLRARFRVRCASMRTIKQEDFIQSVADAFQFISCYHPVDFLSAMGEAYEKERSPAAKNAIGQILVNSRMVAEGHRPICQDTGIAV